MLGLQLEVTVPASLCLYAGLSKIYTKEIHSMKGRTPRYHLHPVCATKVGIRGP